MPVNKRRTLKRRNSKKMSIKMSKKKSKKLKRISRGGAKISYRDNNSTVILDPITGNTVFFTNKIEAIKYNRDRSRLKADKIKLEKRLADAREVRINRFGRMSTKSEEEQKLSEELSKLIKTDPLGHRKLSISSTSTSSDSDKIEGHVQSKRSTPQTPLLGTMAIAQ